MGWYIAGPAKGKAPYFVSEYDAKFIECPKNFDDIDTDKALICIVDNGAFEAGAYCFSDNEFFAFNDVDDRRPKTWMVMDKKRAEELTGYSKRG